MASQPTQTAQLLGTIYGLNKSFTKKILVGLEFDSADDQYTPTVRLLANDFNGVSFSESEWNGLKNTFHDVDRYFRGSGDDLRDQKVYGSTWSLKFSSAHSDRAIEIEDERRPQNGVPVKRFRQSIIMKRVTFDNIQEYVATCVDLRLNLLKTICQSVSSVMNAMVEAIYKKAVASHEAQIQIFTSGEVKNIVSGDSGEEILKTVIASVKDCEKSLTENEISILFFELLSLYLGKIIDLLNLKLH